MAERIVVFGNCQAESIGAAFRAIPELCGAEHVYVRSFNICDEEVAALLTPDVVENCTILFEQKMPHVRLDGRYTFPNAQRITFPSLDLNLLWPLRAEEKRMTPEPPHYPYGRFTYGDRVINEVLQKGLFGDDAWTYYLERSAKLIPDLYRLQAIEEQRWQEIEQPLDVKMSDLVFERLREERLFWTYNHPNRAMLCYMGGRMLRAAGFGPPDDCGARDRMMSVLTWEFGADYHQPIHPMVGEALGLSWWSRDMPYRRMDVLLSFEEFVRRQIAWE